MSNIIEIGGVRGFIDENGVAQLNAEDVARGWGFTEPKNGKEYVRWRTVNGYLREFGFSQDVAKDDFLPENMVYRLGFKASNETAQAFQAKLADEILPTIRKTGSYSVKQTPALPDFTNPAVAARAWAEQFEKRELVEKENLALTAQIETMKPKADYTDKILQSNKTVPITLIAKDYGMSAQAMNKVLHDSHIIWKCSGQWVLYAEYQGTGYTHSKTEPNRNKNGEEVGGVHTQLEWTQKGRLFLYTFLKEKRNLLPIIERNEFEAFREEN